MREYLNTQIVKGEKYYGFVHSPNFKFQYDKFTNDFVYARVTFDYYNWLIKFQSTYQAKNVTKKNETPISKKANSTMDKIKVKVIALIYFYNGQPINRINCNEIAAKYYYQEKTSGEGLFHDYLKFSKISTRVKLMGESKIKCLNRLKLIEIAISHLKGKAKDNAKKDYEILAKAIDDHEW
jgi:hypothetical protein